VRVFAHPLRLDSEGAVATVEQWSPMQAAQVAVGIVSTFAGERELAPQFGIADPVGVGLDADTVAAAIGLCEPDLLLVDVAIDAANADGRQAVALTVAWRDDDDEGQI